MSVMTHRKRVLLALDHEEPDRVPIDLGSTRNSGILIEPYNELVEFLSIGENPLWMILVSQKFFR